MTRSRKRKLKKTAKLMLLTMLPIAVAAISDCIPELSVYIKEAGSISFGKKEKSSDTIENSESDNNSSEDFEDVLAGEYILSEGYGVTEETEEAIALTPNPLYTVSDNPGAKPYPAENEWVQGSSIIRTTYGRFSGTTYFDLENAGQVNNQTTVPNETLINESIYLPDFTIEDIAEPQVLIYHTHTTESFEPYVREFCDAQFNYRTTDETKNMVMVGEEITKQLEEAGIGVIHAKDIHDYPSYNGSYARSRETISKILEENPTIKVVLDIHRDAISNDNGAYQPYTVINGREAAQVMIISGCDDGTLGMPNYMKNFRFASYLQQQLESDNPGFTRPILFDYRKYNQDLTTGSLLIEVGSHGNTLEQVQYSGQLIGKSLATSLTALK